MKTKRWFVRCVDCLRVGMVDDTEFTTREDCYCGLCNGKLEVMGEVKGEKWIEEGVVCECNELCAHARGPKCTCRCGAVNHGKGMLAYRAVDKATGKVIYNLPEGDEKSIAMANEFRTRRDELKVLLETLPHLEEYRKRVWLEHSVWSHINNAFKLLHEAEKGRQHKSRMAKLDKLETLVRGA